MTVTRAYHIFLLLLAVLSAYSEIPQHAKPLDSQNTIRVTNNSSAKLGVSAPVPPQNEVFKIALPQLVQDRHEVSTYSTICKVVSEYCVRFL
jgi:hypothetical protein